MESNRLPADTQGEVECSEPEDEGITCLMPVLEAVAYSTYSLLI